MKRFIAEVIDNNDLEQEGKVQIYIPHLMKGYKALHYPWAKQDKEFTSFIPEIGEYIWVYYADLENFKKPYYQNKVTLKDYHDHNKTIGSMTGIYPNIKYIQLANGVSIALNSLETEVSIKAGTAEIYINPSAEIHIKSGTTTIEASVLGETLQQFLSDLIDAIMAITQPVSGASTTGPLANSADFTALQNTDLLNILSQKIKNN